MKQRDMLEELSQEYAPDMQTTVRQRVNQLLELKAQREEIQAQIEDLDLQIDRLESQDLPALFDEFQIQDMSFKDGVKIKLDNKVFTRVNKPELQKGWEILNSLGRKGIIKPTIIVTVAQDEEKKEIDTFITVIKNSIEHEKVELDFKYHAGQLNAVANDIFDSGEELDGDVFKQSVKRGVKITQPKNRASL